MSDTPETPQNAPTPGPADTAPRKKRRRRRKRKPSPPSADTASSPGASTGPDGPSAAALSADDGSRPDSTAEPAPAAAGNPPGPQNQQKKKTSRRRRDRNRRPAPPEAASSQPSSDAPPAATSPDAQPDTRPADDLNAENRGKRKSAGRGKKTDATSSDRTSQPNPKNGRPDKPSGSGSGGGGGGRKKRKPRTKQCVNCYTPCTTIHRVRLDHRRQWHYICDICWPTRCIDNPHYEFGGTWVTGRIVKPESQLRDERAAKQKQKQTTPS